MKNLPWTGFLLLLSALVAQDAVPSCVTLTWTATGDDGIVGTATQYDIRYSTSYITEQDWNAATRATSPPAPQPAGTREYFTVTGLELSTTYYFAIRAADEHPNWSSMSNVAARTTPEDCRGTVGNVDCDPGDNADISDLIPLVAFLFTHTETLCCPGEANIDGDPDGVVDITDLQLLIDHLWIGFTPLRYCE